MKSKKNKPEKPELSAAEKLIKKYRNRSRRLLAALILFLTAAGIFIYMNINYLAFKYFIAEHYIYTDTLKELYKREINRDTDKYYKYFDEMAISVITKSIRELNNDYYTYLYIPEQYKASIEADIVEAKQTSVSELNESTALLYLSNFSKYTAKFLKDNIEFLSRYPNLIIDLRENYGGDINAMVDICSYFLPKKSIIAVDRMRFIDWTYKAGSGKKYEFDNIIILQGKNTASSSENMIAALKQNLDDVTLIGDETFGKGIGQYTLRLTGGYAVKATVLLWYTPGGENIQGNGIKPDIYYTGEDAVENALKWLQEK